MTTSSKNDEQRKAGLRRMELWWEFSKSSEARTLYQLHAERLRRAFDLWYVKSYPVEAAIQHRVRSDRLNGIVKALKS